MTYRWHSCDLAGPMLPGYEDREIEEDFEARDAPPADVFSLPLVDRWRDHVWDILSDHLTNDVRAAFIRNPPEYVVSDDLSWLDEIIFAATGTVCNIKEVATERLSQEYHAFRAAQATRTNDLGAFYQEGLRCLRADEIEDRARSIFLNGRFHHANEQRLQEAIDNIRARDAHGGREGRLYFSADERSLFSQSGGSGHYLVYGSEYLCCLGMRVTSSRETKRALKEIGRPTMLVCDIPIALLRPSTLLEFAGSILEYLFCELIEGYEAHALSDGAGSALSLSVDLPAQHIVGHYHPKEIYDPLWRA